MLSSAQCSNMYTCSPWALSAAPAKLRRDVDRAKPGVNKSRPFPAFSLALRLIDGMLLWACCVLHRLGSAVFCFSASYPSCPSPFYLLFFPTPRCSLASRWSRWSSHLLSKHSGACEFHALNCSPCAGAWRGLELIFLHLTGRATSSSSSAPTLSSAPAVSLGMSTPSPGLRPSRLPTPSSPFKLPIALAAKSSRICRPTGRHR